MARVKLKKPKKSDFKNCRDPEFAYIYALGLYQAYLSTKRNPFIKQFNKQNAKT